MGVTKENRQPTEDAHERIKGVREVIILEASLSPYFLLNSWISLIMSFTS